MSDHNVWCWELAQHGYGPDWIFIAHVAPASESGLAPAVAATALEGYIHCPVETAYCDDHQQMCQHYMLIDAANAQTYIDNVRGENPRNIWVYNSIRIHKNRLSVECGYSGRGDAYHHVETAFLLDIFAAPGIALQSWDVIAGGEGYDYRTIRSGGDLDSLRAYLM